MEQFKNSYPANTIIVPASGISGSISSFFPQEQEELWDFLWVYIGEEDEEDGGEIETFPHEGRVFGTKSDVEKSLLVEFARLYTDVDVEDYELKLRKW